MKSNDKQWGLLLAPFVLGACGLLKVNINGKTHTLGEPDPEEVAARATSGSSGSGNGSSRGSSSSKSSSSGSSSSGNKKSASKSEKEAHDQLRKDTRALLVEMDKMLIDGPDPIPADKISAMSDKRSAFEDAGLENEAVYLSHLLTYYRLENAWRSEPAKTGESLAKQLKGAITTQGELSGKDKPVSFKFQAEADKCYTIMSHMKMAGGDDDGVTDYSIDGAKSNGSKLQRYHTSPRRTRGSGLMRRLAKAYTFGACALEATEVTVSFTMKYAGSANGLRYVVVENARDKFPKYIAMDIEPFLNDSCDVENWTNLWTNPLPGSVVYGSTQPFLTYDAGTADELWMTAWSPGFGEARLRRNDVTSTPPKNFKFEDKPRFRKCPRKVEDARSVEGLKVAQCYTALNKRFDPLFDAAERAKSNAGSLLAEINAQKRIDALNAQYDAEEDRTCAKIEADVNKKLEDAYTKIVDFYMSTPPKPPFDRAGEMHQQHEGLAEIRCVGTSSCSL